MPSRASAISPRQRDAALAVPALVVQRQVGRLAMPGEVVGEPDAVVRQPGLGAGERDRELAVLEQRLGGGDAAGAGADDEHALGRDLRRRAATGSTRIAVAFSPAGVRRGRSRGG